MLIAIIIALTTLAYLCATAPEKVETAAEAIARKSAVAAVRAHLGVG